MPTRLRVVSTLYYKQTRMKMSESMCSSQVGLKEWGANMREQSGVQVRGEGVDKGCSVKQSIVS